MRPPSREYVETELQKFRALCGEPPALMLVDGRFDQWQAVEAFSGHDISWLKLPMVDGTYQGMPQEWPSGVWMIVGKHGAWFYRNDGAN